MRILIVDDEPVARMALNHALTRAGHEVVAARDGAEALSLLGGDRFRLVISDWIMPGIDGLELCRRIRQQERPAYLYFILLTSSDAADNILQALNAGADEFLHKPIRPAELLARVRAAERVLALETRDLAIFALAKLAESRDPDTGHHLHRVRRYARVLAEHLRSQSGNKEINADFVQLIYLTSPLHDIGKVGLPDAVLLKPGKLSPPEFEVMKTHTTIGAETLAAAEQQFPEVNFLRMAHDITLHHHERYDGTGYPRALAGERIPLSARIVALADVYDALISKRVYKSAYDHKQARDIILQDSGRHFDPRLVDAFQANEAEFLRILDRYRSDDARPRRLRQDPVPELRRAGRESVRSSAFVGGEWGNLRALPEDSPPSQGLRASPSSHENPFHSWGDIPGLAGRLRVNGGAESPV